METNKLTLYELTAEQQAIEDALIENGGELTPELEDAMNANGEAIAVKMDGYNKILRRMEGSEAAIDSEIKRLTALKKTAQNAQRSIKDHVRDAMLAMNVDRIEGTLCKAFLRRTKAINIDEDAMLLPYAKTLEDVQSRLPVYVQLTAKISKTALKTVMTEGNLPAGAEEVVNTSVTIR